MKVQTTTTKTRTVVGGATNSPSLQQWSVCRSEGGAAVGYKGHLTVVRFLKCLMKKSSGEILKDLHTNSSVCSGTAK